MIKSRCNDAHCEIEIARSSIFVVGRLAAWRCTSWAFALASTCSTSSNGTVTCSVETDKKAVEKVTAETKAELQRRHFGSGSKRRQGVEFKPMRALPPSTLAASTGAPCGL